MTEEVNLDASKSDDLLETIDIAAISAINLTVANLVIYTGNTGGGAGEYQASDNPNVPNQHLIDPGLPAGAKIVGTWYTPLHNIGSAISAFFLDWGGKAH